LIHTVGPRRFLTMKLIDKLGRLALLLRFVPLMAIAHLGLAAAIAAIPGAEGAAPAAAAAAAICG